MQWRPGLLGREAFIVAYRSVYFAIKQELQGDGFSPPSFWYRASRF